MNIWRFHFIGLIELGVISAVLASIVAVQAFRSRRTSIAVAGFLIAVSPYAVWKLVEMTNPWPMLDDVRIVPGWSTRFTPGIYVLSVLAIAALVFRNTNPSPLRRFLFHATAIALFALNHMNLCRNIWMCQRFGFPLTVSTSTPFNFYANIVFAIVVLFLFRCRLKPAGTAG